MTGKKWYLLGIGLNLVFIWGNSMLPGDVSGQISGGVFEYVEELFSVFGSAGEFVLRKLGHFSEFGLLGFLLAWCLALQGQRGIHRFSMPLLVAVLIAVTDETIQSFSLGRSPSVIDIWIDVAGACTGIVLLLLCRWIYTGIHNRKGNDHEKVN